MCMHQVHRCMAVLGVCLSVPLFPKGLQNALVQIFCFKCHPGENENRRDLNRSHYVGPEQLWACVSWAWCGSKWGGGVLHPGLSADVFPAAIAEYLATWSGSSVVLCYYRPDHVDVFRPLMRQTVPSCELFPRLSGVSWLESQAGISHLQLLWTSIGQETSSWITSYLTFPCSSTTVQFETNSLTTIAAACVKLIAMQWG